MLLLKPKMMVLPTMLFLAYGYHVNISFLSNTRIFNHEHPHRPVHNVIEYHH